jgi:hypothetical protein
MLGTLMTLFEHIVEQYPPALKKKKYEYWTMLKRANEDYRLHNSYGTFQEEKEKFEKWMKDQWGMIVEVEADGYTPYYTVLDEQKYLLFVIKYGK